MTTQKQTTHPVPPRIGRRAVTAGIAWSVPTVVASTMSPAYADSTCTQEAMDLIDEAFTQINTDLVAYWTVDTASQLNGSGAQRVLFNIQNNSPFDVSVSGAGLMVRFVAYFAEHTTAQHPTGLAVATAYGGVSTPRAVRFTPPDGFERRAAEWFWSAGSGSVIKGNRRGLDPTADTAFSNPPSLVRNPPGTIVMTELRSAPSIKPTWESLQGQYPDQLDGCEDYYASKDAVTAGIIVSGPKLSGTTDWPYDGRPGVLPGGNQPWTVGSVVYSSDLGNYISSTKPPSTRGFEYGYDGIF